jgi:hypothetical protein
MLLSAYLGFISFETPFYVLYVAFLLLFAFGAARLSWIFTTGKGTPMMLSYLYALLAFLLSEFYYVLYTFILNPPAPLSFNFVRRGMNSVRSGLSSARNYASSFRRPAAPAPVV